MGRIKNVTFYFNADSTIREDGEKLVSGQRTSSMTVLRLWVMAEVAVVATVYKVRCLLRYDHLINTRLGVEYFTGLKFNLREKVE